MYLNNSSYGKYLGKHLGKHVNIMFDKMCCKYDDDNVSYNVFVYYDYHKCTESNRSQTFPKPTEFEIEKHSKSSNSS